MTPDGSTPQVADVDPESRSDMDRQEQSPTGPSAETSSARIIGPTGGSAFASGDRATAPTNGDADVTAKRGVGVTLEQLRAFYGDSEQVKGIDLEFRANEKLSSK